MQKGQGVNTVMSDEDKMWEGIVYQPTGLPVNLVTQLAGYPVYQLRKQSAGLPVNSVGKMQKIR
jgi:hypothetical protein